MPQMAPMLWLNLLIYFSIIYFIFLLESYFFKPLTPLKLTKILNKTPLKKLSLNW